ncbi:MAG: SAM-dependent methyltransferase [Pseudobdellovibrionaceae bacterium]
MVPKSLSLQNLESATGYLAFTGFEEELESEILRNGLRILEKRELFFLTANNNPSLLWSQLTCAKIQILPIESIKSAAKSLIKVNRFWGLYSTACHRRAHLIEEALGSKKTKTMEFLAPLPKKHFGFWTLWDENTILYSNKTTLPFQRGEVHFAEDSRPPSRAYLKLWEILTVYIFPPDKNDSVIELGASPGGWTWVLNELEVDVDAFDRSPLREDLMKTPNIRFHQTDIFKISPKDFDKTKWLFSDVIAYPDRLYELVLTWLKEKPDLNIILTIKFQGPTDFESVEKFKSIPMSKVVHLFHNKNEVTFLRMSSEKLYRSVLSL